MSDDWVPWTRIRSDVSHKWDWENPKLRKKVRVGTILETEDCAYLRVKEITADGVVMDGMRFLWTWARLKSREATIYEQPKWWRFLSRWRK